MTKSPSADSRTAVTTVSSEYRNGAGADDVDVATIKKKVSRALKKVQEQCATLSNAITCRGVIFFYFQKR